MCELLISIKYKFSVCQATNVEPICHIVFESKNIIRVYHCLFRLIWRWPFFHVMGSFHMDLCNLAITFNSFSLLFFTQICLPHSPSLNCHTFQYCHFNTPVIINNLCSCVNFSWKNFTALWKFSNSILSNLNILQLFHFSVHWTRTVNRCIFKMILGRYHITEDNQICADPSTTVDKISVKENFLLNNECLIKNLNKYFCFYVYLENTAAWDCVWCRWT